MYTLRNALWMACLALPWLNPFAPGPSPAVVPWLVSLLCVAGLLAVAPLARLPRSYTLFFIAVCAYFTLLFGINALQNGSETAATVLAWLCLMLCAMVGAALPLQGQKPHSEASPNGLDAPGVAALATVWLAVALLSVFMGACQYWAIDTWFAPWISASADNAAYANLRQRNQFASLCSIGLAALLFLHQRSPVRAGTASLWWGAATLLALGNSLSSSRTGALQWPLLVLALVCWRGSVAPATRRLGYGALGIFAIISVLMPFVAQLAGNDATGLWGRAQEGLSGSSRWWLYSNVLELIAQKPWLGWGWRELAVTHYRTQFPTRFVEILDNAHNLPLHLAVELGLPFALLFCGTVLWALVRAAPWRERHPSRQLAWSVLLILGLHSMVEYPLWYGPFLMSLGLCVGLLGARSAVLPVDFSSQKDQKSPLLKEKIASYRTNNAPIATVLIAITGFIAFDYHRVSQMYLPVAQRSAWYQGDALRHALESPLFTRQAQFAELVISPVTRDNAPRMLALSTSLMHYSPEPRVIEALIESAVQLHFDDIAAFHLARYRDTFPVPYAAWSALKPH